MLVGLPAVAVQTLFALKKQNEKAWYQSIWRKTYWLLAIALMVDLSLQLKQIIGASGIVHGFNMFVLLLGAYLIWYWCSSNKLKRFFSNWLT